MAKLINALRTATGFDGILGLDASSASVPATMEVLPAVLPAEPQLAPIAQGALPFTTITGTNGNDILLGDINDNEIFGLAGNDQINGDYGNDVLHGGDGNDFVVGGHGDDLLDGGAGVDLLAGGDGTDSVIYSSALSAVGVNLVDSGQNFGDAAGDVFIEVEA